MEQHFASQDSQMLYGNRLSYSKYQKIRIAESYKPKVGNHSCQNENQSEKQHGFAKRNYQFDEEQLLTEAKTWSPNAKINWTKLGTDMQLTCANRGQVVKEFLAENGIPAALQKKEVVRPSKLKLPGGMYHSQYIPQYHQ